MRFFLLSPFLFLFIAATYGQTGTIQGFVKDKKTGEPLIGATVQLVGTMSGTITDFDGNYLLQNLQPGSFNIRISFLSYKPVEIEGIQVQANKNSTVNIYLEEAAVNLEDVTIVAVKRTNTEIALTSALKASLAVASGISAQQITRSQDQDASQVVKRIPGISIIDDKFIVVRGLNQRYNSVWLNGASTPSTEADQKAFSFDLIPSSMIDNLMISKSPSPDIPADFGGGFIKIVTKNMPDENFFNVTYGAGYVQGTTFSDFRIVPGGKTDFLGFDDGSRTLPSTFPSSLRGLSQEKLAELGRILNNNWDAEPATAFPNQSFSLNLGRRFLIKGKNVGNITSFNYNFSSDKDAITNRGYQAARIADGSPEYNFDYLDEEYARKARLGLLHNWAFYPGRGQKMEFRNLVSMIGKNESIIRNGLNNYEGRMVRSYQNSFMSRLTYTGQFGYEKKFSDERSKLDAIVGYSFANRNEPDIKRLRTTLEDDPNSSRYGQYFAGIGTSPSASDAGRVFMELNEHIGNGAINFERKFDFLGQTSVIKSGLYTEYKTRTFDARILGFAKNSSYTETVWVMPINQLFAPENLNAGPDGFVLRESTTKSDSYEASNMQVAGYLSVNLQFTSLLNFYGGIRIEQNNQHLNSYDRYNQPVAIKKDNLNFFPSANLSYNINEKNLVRLAYGMTINRPEFREIAPFYFYNFQEEADFVGNTKLKDALIHNFDLRFENYPNMGEMFTFGLFYKNFENPIELTFKPAGNRKNYTYENAKQATSFGAELDIRKSLSTIHFIETTPVLSDLSIVANAAYIVSKVYFEEGSIERDRAMQGQSPYLVNVGLFYNSERFGTSVSVLYNIIGDRIRITGEAMQNILEDIPDVYEKHRHQVDVTVTKIFSKKIQIKAGVRDLLSSPVESYQPYANISGEDDLKMTVRKYTPGRNFSVNLTYNF